MRIRLQLAVFVLVLFTVTLPTLDRASAQAGADIKIVFGSNIVPAHKEWFQQTTSTVSEHCTPSCAMESPPCPH